MNRAQRRRQLRRAHQCLSNGAPVLRARFVKPTDDAEAMLTECECNRHAYIDAGAFFVEILHERCCPVLAQLKRGRL